MNKETILRNLEYVTGGLNTLKTLCNNEEKNASYYELFDEWFTILNDIMESLGEDYVICQKLLKNSP